MRSSSCKSADTLNNVFLTITTHENEVTHEEAQKKRKLTNDSGYGDDIPERMVMDSILQNNIEHSFTQTSSLDSISESNFLSARCSTDKEHSLQEMSKRFEQSLNCTPTSMDIDSRDGQQEVVAGACKTKEKRRRMTPVPGGVSVFKPSKSTPTLLEKTGTGRAFLFVEEEDTDDIEGYNLEDDFICPDLHSCRSRLHVKRNSWHGITEGEKFGKTKRVSLSLSKSKSLDRGIGYTRTRKRLANMNIPSISLEELTFDNKRPVLVKQRSLNEDFTEKRCVFDGISFKSSNEQEENLPAWMKEAVEKENHPSSSSSSCSSSGEEDESPRHSCPEGQYCEVEDDEEKKSMEKLSTKLAIPQINWEKLNEEKNKTNKLLSEQRKALNKEKTKASSRRRRKLTPSESPSHSSLEKLSSMKTMGGEDWVLTEEDEEEEDL